jgi:hypothetical protein
MSIPMGVPLGMPIGRPTDLAMDRLMDPAEAPKGGLGLGALEAPDRTRVGLGREAYASFLLLAVTGFTIAGYIGLILLLVGAVK